MQPIKTIDFLRFPLTSTLHTPTERLTIQNWTRQLTRVIRAGRQLQSKPAARPANVVWDSRQPRVSSASASAGKRVSGGVIPVDFDQLTTFLEVVNQGNFSRAGDKVYRSQSAVSAQIRQLEQEYGTRLLDRSGKRVSLTPAGEVLFEYANRLLALRGESLRAV